MEFAGLEKLSLVDYDGHIACTLFTRGCNFRCLFCHNGPLVIPGADTSLIYFDEVMDYLKKRKGVLDAVVITGGEPTLMPDLYEKLKQIKELGYLIKLDTNGSKPEIIKKLVEDKIVDFVAMDIKSSLERYSDVTNSFVNIDKINDSINYLLKDNVPYEFRTTLIDEYHDNEVIEEIGKLIKGAKKYRLQKFVDRDGVIDHKLHEVDKSKAESYINILKKYIDDVELRGY